MEEEGIGKADDDEDINDISLFGTLNGLLQIRPCISSSTRLPPNNIAFDSG